MGAYDAARELVVDPGLEYATFLGGFGNQSGAAIAVDSAGSAYVTGFTQSPTFPTTVGAFDRTGAVGNNLDAFVSKLNPAGTGLVYSTFLGGANSDWGRDLAVDAAGNAYVGGQTKSSDFPTTSGAFDRTFNVDSCPRCGIDQYDGFVAKLNPSGSQLVYSTFLGGFDIDDVLNLAIDGAGQVYVAGQTASNNFPTTSGAYDTSANGEYDAFVAKLDAAGSRLVYSTLLGGADNELPGGIAVDASGNALVGGGTRSTGFPTTAGSVQPTHSGGAFVDLFEGFVTKVNSSGTGLVYSTFLGGVKQDSISDVLVDPLGETYLIGGTQSPDFPTTPDTFDPTFEGTGKSFAVKLNPTGSTMRYSTYLGKGGAQAGALTGDGSIWLAGTTTAADAFVTPDAWDGQLAGSGDVYLAKLNATATAVDYATFLGGIDSEGASDVALDPIGDVYLTGRTRSADFPTTPGAFDGSYNGDPYLFGSDAWIAKLATATPQPPATPGPTVPTSAPTPTPGQPLPGPLLLTPNGNARFEPGTTIAFDWADVPGAASYTIMIDSNDGIHAPATVDETVTGPRYVASGLPNQRMWWRVRANADDGTPGSWSSARRFELKD